MIGNLQLTVFSARDNVCGGRGVGSKAPFIVYGDFCVDGCERERGVYCIGSRCEGAFVASNED